MSQPSCHPPLPIDTPWLELVASFWVDVGPAIDIEAEDASKRRLVPILGGHCEGPKLRARILGGGSDIQMVHADGLIDLTARYVLEASDGARIYVENAGMRRPFCPTSSGGELLDDTHPPYFRSVVRFETAAREHRWLTRHVFICSGRRDAEQVRLNLYRVA